MKVKILSISIMLAVLAALAFSGPAPASEKLALEDAVSSAYLNNPQIQALEENVNGKNESVGLAKAQRLPKFSLSETYTRTNSPVMGFMSVLNQEQFTPAHMNSINDPGEVGNFNTKLSLQAPVFNGWAVKNGIRMADFDRRASDFELARKKQEIRLSVVEAYLGALMAGEGLKVAENAFLTAEAHVKMAGAHLEAGTVVKSDLLSAEVRLAQIDEMRLDARNKLELAKANLLYTMGAKQDRDIVLDDSPLKFTAMENTLDNLLDEAAEKRAELKQLQSYIDMSRSAGDAAAAGRRPSLNVMAEYNMDNEDMFDSQGESWLAGVMFQVNIFDGGRTKRQVKQTRHKELETGRQKEALAQGIELQVRRAFLDLQTAGEKIKVTEKAVTQAEEAMRIVQNRYENGLTTIVEILNSETELTQARMRHVQALHDYAAGLEKLNYAVGVN